MYWCRPARHASRRQLVVARRTITSTCGPSGAQVDDRKQDHVWSPLPVTPLRVGRLGGLAVQDFLDALTRELLSRCLHQRIGNQTDLISVLAHVSTRLRDQFA